MIDIDLNRLQRELPLSPQWERPSVIQHVPQIGDTQIHLAGLSTVDRAGQCVCGSAGQLAGSPLSRAYYELVERTAIIEAMGQAHKEFEIQDAQSEIVGALRNQEIFLQSSDEKHWRYARSNGVAVGLDWQDATRRAGLELTERDRILRSWYGEFIPQKVELYSGLMPRSLNQFYEFEIYLFAPTSSLRESPTVAGIFGFPRQDTAPLVFGFGARHGLPEAFAAAACECIQRLGFLWGEAIPQDRPPFAPTPDFHQEYYLHPPHQIQLRAWLRGDHAKFAGVLIENSPKRVAPYFVDLTPNTLRGRLVVVKALPANELQLTFGRGHPRLRRAPPEPLAIHPIA